MELIEGSETSAYINQTPGIHPKENLLYSEHGESLKSRIPYLLFCNALPTCYDFPKDGLQGPKHEGASQNNNYL
jgi:hypothetical protein